VRQNHEDKEHAKEHGRYHEEVGGDHILHVICQECAPGLRGWFPMTHHVLGNRGVA
jgi:hypothetical protein